MARSGASGYESCACYPLCNGALMAVQVCSCLSSGLEYVRMFVDVFRSVGCAGHGRECNQTCSCSVLSCMFMHVHVGHLSLYARMHVCVRDMFRSVGCAGHGRDVHVSSVFSCMFMYVPTRRMRVPQPGDGAVGFACPSVEPRPCIAHYPLTRAMAGLGPWASAPSARNVGYASA